MHRAATRVKAHRGRVDVIEQPKGSSPGLVRIP
jgi:hypothetical protein